jgi:hypothetical protein
MKHFALRVMQTFVKGVKNDDGISVACLSTTATLFCHGFVGFDLLPGKAYVLILLPDYSVFR